MKAIMNKITSDTENIYSSSDISFTNLESKDYR
jgi:hypothetical protein